MLITLISVLTSLMLVGKLTRRRGLNNLCDPQAIVAVHDGCLSPGDHPAVQQQLHRVVDPPVQFDDGSTRQVQDLLERELALAESQQHIQFDIQDHTEVGPVDRAGVGNRLGRGFSKWHRRFRWRDWAHWLCFALNVRHGSSSWYRW